MGGHGDTSVGRNCPLDQKAGLARAGQAGPLAHPAFRLVGSASYIKWLRHAADPKPGGPYETASTARIIDEAGPPRFRRIYFLAALPGPGVGCKQRFKPGRSSGLDSQLLGTILGPFPTMFGFLGRALYLNI